jgi:5-(carboxyamino)imidazole ribonucleotide mutase
VFRCNVYEICQAAPGLGDKRLAWVRASSGFPVYCAAFGRSHRLEIAHKPRRVSRVACWFLQRLRAQLRRGTLMSALVGVIMGSKSDWSTLSHTADMLDKLGIPYEVKVVSAHRTPDLLFQYAEQADARGIQVIIAGAGGAAHLPGMCAAKTHLPVLGVPVQSAVLSGVDSLLSIVQMPAGIPVATLAIGKAGAINAALLAASILGHQHPQFHTALRQFRQEQTETVLESPDPREA